MQGARFTDARSGLIARAGAINPVSRVYRSSPGRTSSAHAHATVCHACNYNYFEPCPLWPQLRPYVSHITREITIARALEGPARGFANHSTAVGPSRAVDQVPVSQMSQTEDCM
jgi:hypothetical protein